MSQFNKLLSLPLLLAASGVPAFAAESGVAPMAEPLFHVGPLPVTNSMITSWVVALVFIIVVRLAIRKPKLIPSHGQAMVEHLVEGVRTLISPIVGAKVAPTPSRCSFRSSLLSSSKTGAACFPGVGTVYMRSHATGEWMEFVRPGNADMNGTAALAARGIHRVVYFIMRFAGPRFVLKDIFGNKANKKGNPRDHLLSALPDIFCRWLD